MEDHGINGVAAPRLWFVDWASYLLLPTDDDDELVIQQDSLSRQMYKNISTVSFLAFPESFE